MRAADDGEDDRVMVATRERQSSAESQNIFIVILFEIDEPALRLIELRALSSHDKRIRYSADTALLLTLRASGIFGVFRVPLSFQKSTKGAMLWFSVWSSC